MRLALKLQDCLPQSMLSTHLGISILGGWILGRYKAEIRHLNKAVALIKDPYLDGKAIPRTHHPRFFIHYQGDRR